MNNYITDRNKQILRLGSHEISKDTIEEVFAVNASSWSEAEIEVFSFLRDWFAPSEEITVHTSGSTGTPKLRVVRKSQMTQSAKMTCEFLKLNKQTQALLCLPVSFIAGKMMIVRGLVSGYCLHVISTDGYPFSRIGFAVDFVAMVPLQVFNTLSDAVEKSRFESVSQVIIGGAAIDPEIEKRLQGLHNSVFSTYGMTETLSHIALRRVNGPDASLHYTPLPGVSLRTSSDQALIIDAFNVCDETLHTNDIVELDSAGNFRVIGRKDNVINSGGVKLQIEQIEAKIAHLFVAPFAVSAKPDSKLGEKVVLFSEEEVSAGQLSQLEALLSKYEYPKEIIHIEQIPRTESGKIRRKELR
ncbi:MAG: AMP-binding protein [Bacteroidales bacterium]